jgi:lipoate-protein ligase A
MISWHLVCEGRCPSLLNMDRDLSLFRSVMNGSLPGVIRFYNWDEPAITTGHHQKNFTPSDRDLSLPVVKRPTGGGAVLHLDDLTFSISTPEKGAFSRGIVEACRVISRAFAQALQGMGIQARIQGENTSFSPVCFRRSSPVELCLGNEKILGLALLRRKGYLLVQGVLPLSTDHGLAQRVFGSEGTTGTRGICSHAPWFTPEEFIPRLVAALSPEVDISAETFDKTLQIRHPH